MKSIDHNASRAVVLSEMSFYCVASYPFLKSVSVNFGQGSTVTTEIPPNIVEGTLSIWNIYYWAVESTS